MGSSPAKRGLRECALVGAPELPEADHILFMSLFISGPALPLKSLSGSVFPAFRVVSGRKVEEPGNLSRRRQGACANSHDARPERVERRSPCSSLGYSFKMVAALAASPSRKNHHHEQDDNQTSNAPRQQAEEISP